MSIQTIKKTTGKIIYSGEHDSLKSAVEYCCRNAVSLSGASLNEASLNGAKYSILSILKIIFGSLSDEFTLELMRWDAISCGEEKMTSWSKGGQCPFLDSVRDFYFTEKKSLWVPGKPTDRFQCGKCHLTIKSREQEQP